jgi:hypothetical protein
MDLLGGQSGLKLDEIMAGQEERVMARDNHMLVRVVMFSMLFHMPPILD